MQYLFIYGYNSAEIKCYPNNATLATLYNYVNMQTCMIYDA